MKLLKNANREAARKCAEWRSRQRLQEIGRDLQQTKPDWNTQRGCSESGFVTGVMGEGARKRAGGRPGQRRVGRGRKGHKAAASTMQV